MLLSNIIILRQVTPQIYTIYIHFKMSTQRKLKNYDNNHFSSHIICIISINFL